jgi:hypothetical protein
MDIELTAGIHQLRRELLVLSLASRGASFILQAFTTTTTPTTTPTTMSSSSGAAADGATPPPPTTMTTMTLSSIAATSSQHRTPPPLQRLGLYGSNPRIQQPRLTSLYERSMQQKSDHARNIKTMEALQMATFCTFTPKTNANAKTSNSNATNSNATNAANAASNNSHRTATTKATTASSGGTSTSESVFDRLYKGASRSVASSSQRSPARTATRTATARWNGSRQLLHQYSSTESRTSSAVSSRMEELYEKEVRKARCRPKTDQQERRLRDRLREERELQECTFRPQLNWGGGSKKSGKKSSALPVPNQAAPRSTPLQVRSTPPTKLQQPRLPREIIVIPPPPHDTKHRPWHTPRRRQEEAPSTSLGGIINIDFSTVSPLRDPCFVDEQDESSQWITPRITVGSAVPSGILVVTQAGMEYGSI